MPIKLLGDSHLNSKQLRSLAANCPTKLSATEHDVVPEGDQAGKVFQVAAVYAVVAWLIIQVVGAIEEPLNLPDWLDTVVIVLLAVGFPVAAILAWAFDVTPEGVVRDAGDSATTQSGSRTIEFVLIGLLVLP
jgi:hypothetical protein